MWCGGYALRPPFASTARRSVGCAAVGATLQLLRTTHYGLRNTAAPKNAVVRRLRRVALPLPTDSTFRFGSTERSCAGNALLRSAAVGDKFVLRGFFLQTNLILTVI